MKQWLILGLTFLVVIIVRVRLLDMPLERDEGEYAYAGQLILHGVPPYQEVFNMKLPGTYVAYAVIMAIFGQTSAGIHFGLLLVNLASILLVFLIGLRLYDRAGANAAAAAFALMSLSPFILGLAGHATHFVALFALLGIFWLVVCCNQILENVPTRRAGGLMPGYPRPWRVFLAGVFLGLAFLMKQHGVFFGIFGVLYLAFVLFYQRYSIREWCRENRITPALASVGRQRTNVKSQKSGGGVQKPEPSANLIPPPAPSPRRLSHFAAGKLKQAQQSSEPGDEKPEAGDPVPMTSSQPPAPEDQLLPTPGPFSESEGPLPSAASPPTPLAGSQSTVKGPVASPVVSQIPAPCSWFALVPLLAGLAAPYLLTCIVLLAAGVFPEFWFWTVSYASQYATAMSFDTGRSLLGSGLSVVIGPNLPLWLLPWSAVLMIWTDKRLGQEVRFLMFSLLFCSFGSVVVGFYFRPHYFITLLPVLSLMAGLSVSRALRLTRNVGNIEMLLAIPVALLAVLGLGSALIGNGSFWFAMAPDTLSRQIYGSSIFTDTRVVADRIQKTTPTDSRLAVLGSEPQIYFYSRRRSATGFIYAFPLMESHSYARKMQEDMISLIETNRPATIVYVEDFYSWLRTPGSSELLDEWWTSYWPLNLELVDTLNIQNSRQSDDWSLNDRGRKEQAPGNQVSRILTFKRRTDNQHRERAQ